MFLFFFPIHLHRESNQLVAKKCEKDTVLLKIISAMLFVLICMYVILPLFELISVTDSESKPFPYKMIFPYDAYSTFPYVITYFLTSLAGFGVGKFIDYQHWLSYETSLTFFTFSFFFLFCVFPLLSIFSAVTTLFSEDSLFGFFVAYACGQFAILHESIESLIDKVDTDVVRYDSRERSRTQLRNLIDHHNRIIKY